MVSSQLICADCIVAMKDMADDSVDSIVTDPPYGLEFMGKKWDYDVPSVEIWKECFRVLKPGGYLLCFGGSRTYHRVAVNIEDAGFFIRDQIMWLYGSGFPKSHNVSKAIDKAAGVEREVIGTKVTGTMNSRPGAEVNRSGEWDVGQTTVPITTPATPEAKQWEGWGTALKPAHEPIVMARKPTKGTVAENVLEHGTGAINVDGCRVGLDGEKPPTGSAKRVFKNNQYTKEKIYGDNKTTPEAGRFPANVILTHHPECIRSGHREVKSSGRGSVIKESAKGYQPNAFGKESREKGTEMISYNDGSGKEVIEDWECHPECPIRILDEQAPSVGNMMHTLQRAHKTGETSGHFDGLGGASRFFYCAKPSQKERNGGGDNNHPTVKPVDLMRYLCRLVTPPEGTVLDPFMGSGTTGIAANLEGFNFIGIDMEEEYVEIARARIAHSGEYVITEDLTMKRIRQPTMEDFT